MNAAEALTWAAEIGAPEPEDVPPLSSGAADLLRRLDFPIFPVAGAYARPPAPAAGSPSEAT